MRNHSQNSSLTCFKYKQTILHFLQECVMPSRGIQIWIQNFWNAGCGIRMSIRIRNPGVHNFSHCKADTAKTGRHSKWKQTAANMRTRNDEQLLERYLGSMHTVRPSFRTIMFFFHAPWSEITPWPSKPGDIDEARLTNRFMTKLCVGVCQKILCRKGTIRVERKWFFPFSRLREISRKCIGADGTSQNCVYQKQASRVIGEGGGSNFYDRKKPSLLSVFIGCSVAQLSVHYAALLSC